MTRSKGAVLLEKITGIIPGISGYQEREKRRADDLALRGRVTETIARCRQRISDRMNQLSRTGKKGSLRAVGDLEAVNVLLERVEDEIRYAPGGYAGWFDREGVELEDLEDLYEQDLILLEIAGRMENHAPSGAPEAGEEWVQGVKRELEDLRRAFEGRLSLLKGWEVRL
ncbi:MAG: hypothetical protein JXR72_02825 [Proteobacteria bacterium]|nr:hypothetical protein [Pseudomonadota bacterium]